MMLKKSLLTIKFRVYKCPINDFSLLDWESCVVFLSTFEENAKLRNKPPLNKASSRIGVPLEASFASFFKVGLETF